MKNIFFFLLLLPTLLGAQKLTPVHWSFSVEHVEGDIYELVYTAEIEKGWNVYSQFLDEGGPYPTTITYEAMGGATLEGIGEASGYKKEGMDPLFDMNVIKYLDKQPFIIKQRIHVPEGKTSVSGYLTYMTCDDERCLPPVDVEFSFDLDHKLASNEAKPKNEDRAVNDIQTTEREVLDPVQWEIEIKHLKEDFYEIKYTATIAKGWNVYSQFLDEGGPWPTTITYDHPESIELLGPATEEGYKKEGMDPLFDMNVIKYLDKQPFVITQQLKVKDHTRPIDGYLTYMTCDDTKCLPPIDVDFSLVVNKTSGEKGESFVPPMNLNNTDTDQKASVDANGAKIIDQVRPRLRETFETPLGECGEVDTKDSSLPWMFVFGFLGGLLALLTPCVFPMIPMTVSFFTKDTKRKGWVNALIYGLSIIVIYVTIGLLITGIFGASALNALSTNWIANTLFFFIFVFFAFSFFGFYEITLPSSWSTKSDRMADKGGLIGIFFMAFTLAIVSFSCTGPIIGTALVQSATDTMGPLVVMLGFSTALALPFGLFAAFPAFLNSLPQSGGWMNSVKVILGFIELALAFKFLSVADLTSHWGFLRYELFLGVWILVALGMAAYGFGWIRFPHDSPVTKLSLRRWVFSLASIALAG